MSAITVKTGWIVGTPDSASQLVTQIISWVALQTAWVPDLEALEDMERLKKEVMENYDIPGEGYCAFATQIVDATLNRIYPYLIELTTERTIRIDSERKKILDADDEQAVEYTLIVTLEETPPTDEEGDPLPNIEGNPFPLPNEISPTPIVPIAGSPTPVYEPTYPGLPYNPLDPLSREPNPYPAREDQPSIPYAPGDTNVPGSPIQERPSYEQPDESYRELLDSLPRASEINLEGIPNPEGGAETPDAGETETPDAGETETPDEEEKIPDELIPLLKRILYEIENQGSLIRDDLTKSVLSILGGMSEQTAALQGTITTTEELLGKVISNNSLTEQALLKSIVDQLKDKQEEPEDALSSLLTMLGEALDETGEWIKSGFKAVANAADSGLDAVQNGLRSIGGILESGFDAVAEAVSNGLTSLKESIAAGNKTFLDWLASAFEFNQDDFSKYLCAFLTEIEKCKECGYLQAHKEG